MKHQRVASILINNSLMALKGQAQSLGQRAGDTVWHQPSSLALGQPRWLLRYSHFASSSCYTANAKECQGLHGSSHGGKPSADVSNQQLAERLAVAILPPIMLLRLHFIYDYLQIVKGHACLLPLSRQQHQLQQQRRWRRQHQTPPAAAAVAACHQGRRSTLKEQSSRKSLTQP